MSLLAPVEAPAFMPGSEAFKPREKRIKLGGRSPCRSNSTAAEISFH